jgi:hypothetical protein
MKTVFSGMCSSWLKTLGFIKNYIVPSVTMAEAKKSAFVDALDS